MRPVRFGLVGAGGIAQSYVEVFDRVPGARIEAVADVVQSAAAAIASRCDCPAFDDHEALARHADVDAVLVCTPPRTHVDIALHFAERGVPVLCEKPFAVHPEDARRLIDVAAARDVLVTMAAKFRYVADVVHAKRIVDSGVLGETVLFQNVFASRVPMAGRWNADPAVAGGGVLIDNGTHSVDVARYFLGPVVEVSAVEGKRIQVLPVEDTVQMFVRAVTGAMGTVDLSWSVDKGSDTYVGIYGSDGTIEVGWRTSRYRCVGGEGWIEFGRGYDKIAAMTAQVANFCGALRGDEELQITAADAIASVEVVAAAYRSLGRDHWVPVADPGIAAALEPGADSAA